MDWSWLTNIFSAIWSAIKYIVHLKWSDIWRGLQDLVHKLRSWYAWYVANVQKPMQAAQQKMRALLDHFILPIVKVVDDIRRLLLIVGLFNQRIAAKLNLVFLNIEAKLLAPLNLYANRINLLSGMFPGFLTQLGYFDRSTLDNSIWRDVRQLREIFRNPLAGTIAQTNTPTTPAFSDSQSALAEYLESGGGPLQPRVDQAVQNFHSFLGA